MTTRQHNGYLLLAFAIIVTLIALLGAQKVISDDPTKAKQDQKTHLIHSLQGPELFHAYCATCHGVDGKGSGPVTPALNTKVPDLTTIAKRNGGVFPAQRVRNLIAGDELVTAHGSREMPIWGPIFHQIENDRDYGNIRLQNVTEYVRSIQGK